MVQSVYRYAPKYQQPAVVAKIVTIPKVLGWMPTMALWGAGALGAVLFFADSIPLYRHDVLEKLPLVGWYYNDAVDPEDTPF